MLFSGGGKHATKLDTVLSNTHTLLLVKCQPKITHKKQAKL